MARTQSIKVTIVSWLGTDDDDEVSVTSSVAAIMMHAQNRTTAAVGQT